MKKGLNIEVTSGQYEFLYDLVMMAYELMYQSKKVGICKPMITFDNVCQAKETYLSEGVRFMKSFSAKYFPDLNEFEHQYNDIWFNNMLNKLTEKGQLYVPILNKSFNKLGEEIENSMHLTNTILHKEDLLYNVLWKIKDKTNKN